MYATTHAPQPRILIEALEPRSVPGDARGAAGCVIGAAAVKLRPLAPEPRRPSGAERPVAREEEAPPAPPLRPDEAALHAALVEFARRRLHQPAAGRGPAPEAPGPAGPAVAAADGGVRETSLAAVLAAFEADARDLPLAEVSSFAVREARPCVEPPGACGYPCEADSAWTLFVGAGRCA